MRGARAKSDRGWYNKSGQSWRDHDSSRLVPTKSNGVPADSDKCHQNQPMLTEMYSCILPTLPVWIDSQGKNWPNWWWSSPALLLKPVSSDHALAVASHYRRLSPSQNSSTLEPHELMSSACTDMSREGALVTLENSKVAGSSVNVCLPIKGYKFDACTNHALLISSAIFTPDSDSKIQMNHVSDVETFSL